MLSAGYGHRDQATQIYSSDRQADIRILDFPVGVAITIMALYRPIQHLHHQPGMTRETTSSAVEVLSTLVCAQMYYHARSVICMDNMSGHAPLIISITAKDQNDALLRPGLEIHHELILDDHPQIHHHWTGKGKRERPTPPPWKIASILNQYTTGLPE